MRMRVLGIDVGARRIGLAISDASATLARPLGCVGVSALDAAALTRVAAEVARLRDQDDGIETVVVGLPRRLNGEPTQMTAPVRKFAEQLGRACGLPIVLQDERLSSHEAETLLAERIKDWRERKRLLDAASAAVILQDYLDAGPARAARQPAPLVDGEDA
jgi:putative holliday junction resolvase